ncbi:MAG TPA: UDP-N-acetylmuramoyl-tripeptide--D-alanyl-D-alanine ligase, partial [Candidatus Limnocylindrales bacterium]|nr:UDP-N-acetylmuramoyl-tripeptide--D-alanyl-D-alanine ligase [Candidatus Limnocylindrales bacterium]
MSDGSQSPSFGADEVVALAGGRVVRQSDRPVRGAAVDSRLVRPGNVFIALPGAHVDGHAFVGDAIAAGAAAAIVSREPADLEALGPATVIVVDDPLAALHRLAAAWRRRFDPLVVGITGSIAKTSTKEAVAAVLGRHYRTLRTPGNMNNEIGLPVALLDLEPEHEAAVLEMGMYVGGEIATLAAIARPDIGVVTAVQGVHLSRAGTLDAIEDAKAELVEALPASGVAVLSADDARVRGMADRTPARVLTYGFAADADVRAVEVRSEGFSGMAFWLRLDGQELPVRIPTLGALAVHNALAAAAVGRAAGLSTVDIVDGLAAGWSAPHRAQLSIVAGVAVVDDAYNASPGSMRAALELLSGLPGRRIAVLGEMRELGEAASAGHREVGAAAAVVCDLLLVVGPEAAGIADGAIESGLGPDAVVRAA